MLHIQMDQTDFIWPVFSPVLFSSIQRKQVTWADCSLHTFANTTYQSFAASKLSLLLPPPLKFTEKNKTNIINSRPEAFPALAA